MEANLNFTSDPCDTYGIKHKPTSVKNPQANAIMERIHAVLGNMLCRSELKTSEMVKASDINDFLSDTAWAVCSTMCTKRQKVITTIPPEFPLHRCNPFFPSP